MGNGEWGMENGEWRMGTVEQKASFSILHSPFPISFLQKKIEVFPISSTLEIRNHFFHHLKSSAPKMSRMSSTNDTDPAIFTVTPVA